MSSNLTYASANNFQDLLSQNELVLVDFFATWCNPCKMLSPIIDKLSQKYSDKLKIVKVDIDEQSDLAMQYNVQSVPTVILFKNGNVISKEVGAKSITDYWTLIDSAI